MTISISSDKPALVLPSTVDMLVDWLKAEPAVAALVTPGSRISSSLPVRDEDITYPWLTVKRVIGIPVLPQAGIDRARCTFNSWGGVTSSGAPDWSASDLLIRTVEHAIRNTNSVRIPGKGIIRALTGLEGIQQLEDPDTGGARWWMDAIIVTQGERPTP